MFYDVGDPTRIDSMPLPILNVRQEPSREDLVRLFHRTEAMWVGHLVEGVSLEAGAAYAWGGFGGDLGADYFLGGARYGGVTGARAVGGGGRVFWRRGE